MKNFRKLIDMEDSKEKKKTNRTECIENKINEYLRVEKIKPVVQKAQLKRSLTKKRKKKKKKK